MGRLAAEDADYVVQAAGLVAKGQRAKTADELIANRAELLRAYQNEDYAQQYRRVLVRVQDREQVVRPGSTALTESVARYLYKLMAYKDEYEVARLYTDGDFLKSSVKHSRATTSCAFIWRRRSSIVGSTPKGVRGSAALAPGCWQH